MRTKIGLTRVWLITLSSLFHCVCMRHEQSLAAESPVLLDMELASDELYVGEMPFLVVRLKAPEASPVSIIKAERAHHTGALRAVVFSGTQAPEFEPLLGVRREPGDYQQLEAGKSLTMRLEAGEPPQRPGTYTARVSFSPTPDRKFTVNRDLHLRCVEIPRRSIKDTLSFALPNEWPQGEKACTVELMNLATPTGHELTLRATSLTEAGPWTRVTRICALEPESKLLAVTKKDIWPIPPTYRGVQPRVWQLLVVYTRAGQMHFLRLAATSGHVIETRELSAPLPADGGAAKAGKSAQPN